jgi:hypothetical protein
LDGSPAPAGRGLSNVAQASHDVTFACTSTIQERSNGHKCLQAIQARHLCFSTKEMRPAGVHGGGASRTSSPNRPTDAAGEAPVGSGPRSPLPILFLALCIGSGMLLHAEELAAAATEQSLSGRRRHLCRLLRSTCPSSRSTFWSHASKLPGDQGCCSAQPREPEQRLLSLHRNLYLPLSSGSAL